MARRIYALIALGEFALGWTMGILAVTSIIDGRSSYPYLTALAGFVWFLVPTLGGIILLDARRKIPRDPRA